MATAIFRFGTLAYTLGWLALAVPACRRGANETRGARVVDSSPVVAKVEGAVITVSDVQEGINKQAPFVRARYTSPAKRREFVDGLVQVEVLAAEALRRGYDKDPEVQRLTKQQMISKMVQEVESKLKVEDVPDADVKKYYDEHPADFHQKAEVQVSVISLKEKGKADHAYSQARGLSKLLPSSFEAQHGFRNLVAKYSDDRESRSRGGDLPFFGEDSTTVPRPIVEAAFKLERVDDVAPPVKTDKGWAVIRLAQKRPAFSRPLPEVRRQIQQRLLRELRSKTLDALLDDLQKRSHVSINEANLSKVVVEADTDHRGELSLPGPLGPPLSAPAPERSPRTRVRMPASGAPQVSAHP